ncbi:MAG TPA: EAL domain-containing protein [Rhodocyclaceae bacterium]|nr:EAL domain-containing protein [Rhodocyclaceae bacterium]
MDRDDSRHDEPAEDLPGRDAAAVLRILLDHLPSGVALFGPDLQMRVCNAKFKQLLDFPAGLFAARLPSFSELLRFFTRRGDHGAGDPEAIAAEFLARVGRHEHLDFERAMPDGSVLRVTSTPLPAGGLLAVYSDITEQKSMERILRESEARFRDLTEMSSDWFWEQDADFRFKDMSGGLLYKTTLQPRTTIGKTRRDLPIVGVNEEAWRAHWQVLEAHRPFEDFCYQIKTEPGALRWFSVSGKPVFDADGVFQGYRGTGKDITERRGAERVQQLTHLEIEDAHKRLSFQFERLPLAYIVWDRAFRVTEWNPAAERVFGWPAAEAIGRHAYDLVVPEDARDAVEAAWRDVVLGGNMDGHSINDNITRAGRRITCEWFNSPMRDEQGEIVSCLSMVHDISDRIAAENQLRLAAEVFGSSHEAIVVTDRNNRILTVNRAFTEVTGFSREEVAGHDPSLLASGRHGKEFFAQMWRSLVGNGYWQGEIWDRRKNGEVYPKWLSVSAVKGKDGEIANYVAIFNDISERKAAEEKIDFLAHHDPLTRLPNRVLLRDRFEQAVTVAEREQARVALLFLDLDKFKEINDSLGHTVGDELLVQISARLQACVRASDTICRQGGDEFIILLNAVPDVGAVSRIAQAILESVSEPIELSGDRLVTSFSIGISLYPDDGRDFTTLLKMADTAMYHAKESGGNGLHFFTEEMNVNLLQRLQLQNKLRDALKNRELLLHYQPQIDLRSGAVIGFEALLRWDSPSEGLVPPARFIPIAEEGGAIVAIGEWVLNEACLQAKKWIAKGLPPFVMAVNLSALQFKRGDICATVIGALARSGLPAAYLELELTESILLQNTENVLAHIGKLKALGLKLSIDDFGTGYSSLSYLKRLRVDKLKIDQSFVRDLADDAEDAAIARAIIQLGESLQLEIVAEGVETDAQLAILRDYGCQVAQGYRFCHPLPADLLWARLAAGDFDGTVSGGGRGK